MHCCAQIINVKDLEYHFRQLYCQPHFFSVMPHWTTTKGVEWTFKQSPTVASTAKLHKNVAVSVVLYGPWRLKPNSLSKGTTDDNHTTNGVFTPEQDNDKTNVEPMHLYYVFHTRSDMSGVKGIIGMHRFNICLVIVLSLSCSGVKTPLELHLPKLSTYDNAFTTFTDYSVCW